MKTKYVKPETNIVELGTKCNLAAGSFDGSTATFDKKPGGDAATAMSKRHNESLWDLSWDDEEEEEENN